MGHPLLTPSRAMALFLIVRQMMASIATFSSEELKARMADPALLWSPWFRVIARELLFPWWAARPAPESRPEPWPESRPEA